MKGSCSIESCERPARTKGWCSMHYKRWWKTGDPHMVRPPGLPRSLGQCRVPECAEPVTAKDLCAAHYQRARRGVDPTSPLSGPGSFWWVERESLDYDTLHERLRRYRGSAHQQVCIGCGGSSHHWAYQHTDPDPLISQTGPSKGCEFTDDLMAYAPMCRSCHRAFDQAWRDGSIVKGGDAA